MHCSTDSLKNPEGDSPQYQQKNGSLGLIKNEIYVQKCNFHNNFDQKTVRKPIRLFTEWLTKPKNWDEVVFTDENNFNRPSTGVPGWRKIIKFTSINVNVEVVP